MDGHGGITFIERLYVTGLMDTFDKVKQKYKELIHFIFETIRVDKQSIDKIFG